MGGISAERACDISLGELGGTDKQRNIKHQAKELDTMGWETGSQNHRETNSKQPLLLGCFFLLTAKRGATASSSQNFLPPHLVW